MESEFSSGRAVYRRRDDDTAFLIHRATTHEGILTGDLLNAEAWRDLLTAEEATQIQPVEVTHPVVGWIFRTARRDRWWTSFLDSVAGTGAILHRIALSTPKPALVCLVRPLVAGTARELWAERYNREAWQQLLQRVRKDALRLAKRAWCIAPRMLPRDAAMLAFTYSQAGLKEDSEGTLAMVRRSKDPGFYAEVVERRSRLLDELHGPPSTIEPRRPHSRARQDFAAAQRAQLQDWSRSHEAPSPR
jgi:hypothetical protein